MVSINPTHGSPVPAPSIDPPVSVAVTAPAGSAAPAAGAVSVPADTRDDSVEQRASRLLGAGMTPPKDGTGAAGVAGAAKEVGSMTEQPFDFYTISTVFMMLAIAMRKVQREQKQAALEGQVKELMTGVADARDAAGKRFTAAMIQSVLQAVSAVAQGAFAGVSLRLAYKMQLSPTTNAAGRMIESESNFQAVNTQLGAKAQGFSGMGQASSQFVNSIGSFAAAFFERAAGMKDADSREADARAKMAEAAVQQASDAMNDAKEAFTKVMEILADLDRTNTEGTKAAARNI